MTLKHEFVLAKVNSLNGEDGETQSLVSLICTMSGCTRRARRCCRFLSNRQAKLANLTRAASFHAATFHKRAETFLGESTALFVDHCTNSSGEIVEFMNTAMSHTRTTSSPLLQIFSGRMRLHSEKARDRKVVRKPLSKVQQHQIIQNVPKFGLEL